MSSDFPPPGPPPPYASEPYQPYGPPKRNTGAIVLAVGACVLAVGLIAAALLLTLRGGGDGLPKPEKPLLIQQVTAVASGGCTGSGVPSSDGRTCYQLAPGLTITELEQVDVVAPQTGSGWTVELTLRPADRTSFGRLTAQVYGQQQPRNQLALVLDGRVISAPTVQQPVLGGRVSIAGPFSKAEANRLADQLAGRS